MTAACSTRSPSLPKVDTSGWALHVPTILRVVLFSDRGEHTSLGWDQMCDRHQHIPADGCRRPHHPTATMQAMGFERMALGDLADNVIMQSHWAAVLPNITFIDVGRMDIFFNLVEPHRYAEAIFLTLQEMMRSTRALISNKEQELIWRHHMTNNHR